MTTAPRVALLSTFHQRCGLATYAGFLADALEARGARPLVLAERGVEPLGPDRPDTLRCWTRERDGGRELAEILRARGVQLLHVNYGAVFSLEGWLPELLAEVRRRGVRVVTSYHETESHGRLGLLARLSDRSLVHHAQNRLELVALGAPADRVEVLPHGLPRATFTDLFEAKLALGWDPARKVVGTFGFIDPHKGIHELVEAMAQVRRDTGAELRVLGTPHPSNPAGPAYLEACRRRARELGLEGAVHFADRWLPDDELLRHLRACDVIAMNYQSARFETSGAALFALGAGRPIVSSAAPAFAYPEPVTFQTTATFALPTALSFVLQNPFVGVELRAAQRRLEAVAAWDVVAARVQALHAEVAAAPAGSTTDRLQAYASHPDAIYADGLQRERVRWLRGKARGRILEIGPANGYVSELVGASAAVDIHRTRLEAAAALRPTVRFQYGNVVEGLPFGDKAFDLVLAPEILEHIEQDEAVRALRECARVGERVLLTLPNADKPGYDPDLVHNIEHRWLVDRAAVERVLAEAGCGDWELDVSEGADFYLVDARSGPGTGRATPRADRLAAEAPRRDRPLHLAVDGSALEEPSTRAGGPARHALHLLDALARQRPGWRFTWLGAGERPGSPELARACDRPATAYAPRGRLGALAPDVLYLPHPTGAGAAALLEALPPGPPFVAAALSDLAPAALLPRGADPVKALGVPYLRALRLLQERGDLLLCGSQRAAQDAQGILRLPLSRLRIVHGAPALPADGPAAEPGPLLGQLGLRPGRFLLAAGNLEPRRNAGAMFLALAAARRLLGEDVPLVLTGPASAELGPALAGIAAECGLPRDALRAAGHLDEPSLAALYRSARALLHPSLVGGYGLSLLEALAAGLPALTGTDLAQEELCGGAALAADPASVPALGEAIARLWRDDALHADLAERGRARARRFTWERAAEKTAIYLAEALAQRSARA